MSHPQQVVRKARPADTSADMVEEEVPHFPPVSRIIRTIPAGDKRRMLEPLYPDYVFSCSFVHGLPEAMLWGSRGDNFMS